MDFYFVEKDHAMELPIDGDKVTYLFLKADPTRITADRLYFAPSDEISRVVDRFKGAGYQDFEVKVLLDKRQVFEHPQFPLNLTYSGGFFEPDEKFVPLEEKLKPLLGKDRIRVAIVNGMGGGIGDNIVGMTALNIFYDRLRRYFKEVDIGVFTIRPRGIPILRQETIVNEIYLMPAPAELLFQYDAVVDLSNMTGWPIFRQEMVDFYLQAMSIDPKSVPAEEKRCFVKLNERVVRKLEPVVKALKTAGRKLLLFHPASSSAIRSVPQKLIHKYLSRILGLTNYLVVSLLPLKFTHPRFVSLAHYSRQSFDHFAYLISQMDAVITVDTAVYHVADAFSIPSVVLFTSIPPEHRISYYPYQKGFLIGGRNGEPLFYRHASEKEEEVKKLEKEWRKFKINQALEALYDLEKKRERIPKHPCPVCETPVPFIPTDRYRTYRHLRCERCEAEFGWPRKNMDNSRYIDFDPHRLDPETLYKKSIENPRFDGPKLFLGHLPEKRTLLDVGCGMGFFVRYAAGLGFASYGMDASQVLVDYGRKHYGLHTIAVASSIGDLPPYFPEKFQVITAFELLEHLEDPRKFIREVYEKLEDGGLFIFSTPNRDTMGRRMGRKDERAFFCGGGRDNPLEHLTRFTLRTHRILATEGGLKVLWQWVSPPLPEDFLRALGDEFRIPDLNFALQGQKFTLSEENLKPVFLNSLSPVLYLLQEQGLTITTVAMKVGSENRSRRLDQNQENAATKPNPKSDEKIRVP